MTKKATQKHPAKKAVTKTTAKKAKKPGKKNDGKKIVQYMYVGKYPIDFITTKCDKEFIKLTPAQQKIHEEGQKLEAARLAAQPKRTTFTKTMDDYKSGLQVLIRTTPLLAYDSSGDRGAIVTLTTICNNLLHIEEIRFGTVQIACEHVEGFSINACVKFCDRAIEQSKNYLPKTAKYYTASVSQVSSDVPHRE